MLKKSLILVLVLSVLVYLCYRWISSLPKIRFDESIAITPQTGEEIFWGKGTCHICHRIGERGSARRGPNLGAGREGANIARRASERAAQLGLTDGIAYLVQSLAEPGAFVTPGYKDEMPEVFKTPILLSPAEIKAVIVYLQSLGGDTTRKEIKLPSGLLASYQARRDEMDITGDPVTGRLLFFDLEGAAGCAACHVGVDAAGVAEGGAFGPDLTAIASYRTPEHILQKIVKPDSNVVSGYEEVLIKTKDGQFLVGRIDQETREDVVLLVKNGERFSLRRDLIKKIVAQKKSSMPSNYSDLLTKDQMDDVLAYLLTLTGRKL